MWDLSTALEMYYGGTLRTGAHSIEPTQRAANTQSQTQTTAGNVSNI
jgi:hypothetical protein